MCVCVCQACMLHCRVSLCVQIVSRVRDGFRSFKTLDISFRRTQLKNLQRMIKENEGKFVKALNRDLNKVRSINVKSLSFYYTEKPPIKDTLKRGQTSQQRTSRKYSRLYTHSIKKITSERGQPRSLQRTKPAGPESVLIKRFHCT